MNRFYYCLAALLLIASCAKELDFDETAISREKASLKVGLSVPLKTHMDEETFDGKTHKLYWSEGDQIAVNGNVSDPLENVEEKAESAEFSFEATPTPYKVLYPASAWADDDHISLPAVQHYRSDSFEEGMLPMSGYSPDGNSITLTNLCAILKIQVLRGSDGDYLVSARFRGRDNEQVSGRFSIDYQNATLTGTSDSDDDKVVRAQKYMTTSTTEAASYYIVVPAGTYKNGFDVIIRDVNGHCMTKSKTESKTLEAGHMYVMKEFVFSPTWTEVGVEISNAQALVDFAVAYNNREYEELHNDLLVTLTDDIVFDEETSAAFSATGGIGFRDETDGPFYFQGMFNGNGHTISSFTGSVPIFAYLGSWSYVKNLTLDSSCSFSFKHHNEYNGYFGSVVGYNAGIIKNVSSASDIRMVPGSVDQQTELGGLAGLSNGHIQRCSYSGNISVPADYIVDDRKLYIGGLAGEMASQTASVEDSSFGGTISNEGQVTSTDKANPYTVVGGIVGGNHAGGTITGCTTEDHPTVAGIGTGSGYFGTIVNKSIVSYHTAVGGVAGESRGGSISNCQNYASILNTIIRKAGSDGNADDANGRYMRIGGIVGRNNSGCVVSHCDNYASIYHRSDPKIQSVGGIVGLNDEGSKIESCTNHPGGSITLATTSTNSFSARYPLLGGIVGSTYSPYISDVHNQAPIQVDRTENNVSVGYGIGGVIGASYAPIDGGAKSITNSGNILINYNLNRTAYNGLFVGGIVGRAEASVKNAVNSGNVTWQFSAVVSNVQMRIYMGGVVGGLCTSDPVEVSGCDNSGEVYLNINGKGGTKDNDSGKCSDMYLGGIVGKTCEDISSGEDYMEFTPNLTIRDCSNSGYVHGGNNIKHNGTANFVGGIVAYISGKSAISGCTNSGQIFNQQFCNTETNTLGIFSGGIAGYVKGDAQSRISISGCAVTSDKLAAQRGYLGGIAGYAEYVDIDNCSSSADYNTSAWHIGGIAGWMLYSSASGCTVTTESIRSTQLHKAGGIVAVLDLGSALAGCTSSLNLVSAVLTNNDEQPFEQAGAIAGSSIYGTWISNCTYPSEGTIVHGNAGGTTNHPWQICGDTNFSEGVPGSPKKVSIIGDSISTYSGYIVTGYRAYYPTSSVADITSVTQTYWYKFIYEYMPNATLCKNLSWSGSLVQRIPDETYSTTHWYSKYFYARAAASGFGDADVLIVNGGTNDLNYQGDTIAEESDHTLAPGYKITGTALPSDAEFEEWFAAADAATDAAKVAELADDSFIQAYVKLLQLAKITCPSGLKIILVIGDALNDVCEASIQKIATHYGAAVVDFYALNGNYKTPRDASYNPIPKGSSCHPNAQGMAFMAEYMWTQTSAYLSE